MPPWRHERARRRRAVAIAACLVWLLGLEVGPNLHLALHDVLAAHDHDARPPRARVEATPRHHGEGAHRHGDVVHRHDAPAGDEPADPPPERDHAGGLAHRDDLFAPAPPALAAPLPVDPPALALAYPAPPAGVERAAPAAAARGPPATSAPA